jgi:signal transduction histidine kinase
VAARHSERIALEQAAFRRVATMVARGSAPEDLFAAVTAEIGLILEVDYAVLVRYEAPDGILIVGTWTSSGAAAPTSVGSRLPLGGRNVTTLVHETGRPARIDYAHVSGTIGTVATRDWRLSSSVGVPIVVEGRLWGVIVVAFTREELLPPDAEERLAGFTDLVATAVASAQARVELRTFAEEQAALHRVATLVASGTPPEQVFATVAAEAGDLLGAAFTVLNRYEPDETYTVVGAWSSAGAAVPLPVGTRLPLGGHNASTLVFETGRPARIENYASSSGPATEVARDWGVRESVAVPINVEGRLWGVIVAASQGERLPSRAPRRLVGFTELIATALANAQARTELRGFGKEQAALRRVATLVAQGTPPEIVFSAVAEEIGQLLAVDYAVMSRYDSDGLVTVVGGWASADPGRPLSIGLRLKPEGHNIHALVLETERPARIDQYDGASGAFAEVARDWGYRSSVGTPIIVEGTLWGVVIVGSRTDPLPTDSEPRLVSFTELVATAIANAQAQAALTASRARIVAAADAARRRIERDLHDGAQQRLVTVGLRLRAAQAMAPPDLSNEFENVATEVDSLLGELREIARGIHPAALSDGGLPTALKTLARRSAVTVRLDVRVGERLSDHVELAAYYTVAEALTNAAKHAGASVVDVSAERRDDMLHIEVRDDGRGGATLSGGSGLIGLADRIEALGGRLSLDSPLEQGTTLRIALPINTDAPAGPGSGAAPTSGTGDGG